MGFQLFNSKYIQQTEKEWRASVGSRHTPGRIKISPVLLHIIFRFVHKAMIFSKNNTYKSNAHMK